MKQTRMKLILYRLPR